MSPAELKTRHPEYKVERSVREPKVDIGVLMEKGYVTEGQRLFPVDY